MNNQFNLMSVNIHESYVDTGNVKLSRGESSDFSGTAAIDELLGPVGSGNGLSES